MHDGVDALEVGSRHVADVTLNFGKCWSGQRGQIASLVEARVEAHYHMPSCFENATRDGTDVAAAPS